PLGSRRCRLHFPRQRRHCHRVQTLIYLLLRFPPHILTLRITLRLNHLLLAHDLLLLLPATLPTVSDRKPPPPIESRRLRESRSW
ncbi:unnamed protein product, partial [Brassica oleracea var. botrytis]